LKPIGVGLIGAGIMGTYGHYPGYAEIPSKAKVVAVCDKDEGALGRLAEKSGAAPYTDYNELLKDPAVDAVDICLPHFLHGRVALAAIEAGKHVIVEKPFTLTLEEADRVISAARRKGVKLMVAENMRFVKAYEVAKQLVDAGEIGEICYARGYTGGPSGPMTDPNDWRGKISESGGGTMMDDGIHFFYLFPWLVGEVTSVFAATTQFVKAPRDTEDNAVGTLRFANGAMGIFSFSCVVGSPWTEQMELYGREGSIHVDFLSYQPIKVFTLKGKPRGEGGGEPWSRYGDVSWQEPMVDHSTQDWVTDAMKREVQHFTDCIIEDKQPLVSGEDGRRSIALVLKAYESAKVGKELQM
jgi:predicted dehydrogenase